MVPEDIDDFTDYSNMSQLKAIHSLGHIKSGNMIPHDIDHFKDYSGSISKIKAKKYNRSGSYKDNSYQNARKSYKRNYKDCQLNDRDYRHQRSYERNNVSPWSHEELLSDLKEKCVSKCYLDENVFIPDHNMPQSQRYKHGIHISNVKKSRRSASITSNDSSYVDYDSDISPRSLNDSFEFPSTFAYTRNSEVCMNTSKDVCGDEQSISMNSDSSEKGFDIDYFLKRNENQDWKKWNDSNQQIIGGTRMDFCNNVTLGESNTANETLSFKKRVNGEYPEPTGPKEPICKELQNQKMPYLRIKSDKDLLRSDSVGIEIPNHQVETPWTTPDVSVTPKETLMRLGRFSHTPELSHLPQTYSPVRETNSSALFNSDIPDYKEQLETCSKVKNENIKSEYSEICFASPGTKNVIPRTYSTASNYDVKVKTEVKEEDIEVSTLKKECTSPEVGSDEEMDSSYYDNLQYSWSMGWDEELI